MSANTVTVVLIHGYLGFGATMPGLPSYFNQVAQALEQPKRLRVICPALPPHSTVQERSAALAQALHALPATSGERDLYLIAHSMGGLDARFMLSQDAALAQRVHSLVTLGTPFCGSPVADALALGPDKVPMPLRVFVQSLLRPLGDGLHSLTTTGATQLSQSCSDPAGIHRFSVVGAPPSHLWWPASPFTLLSRSQLFAGQPNDGLVTHLSAQWPGFTPLPDWPVDHAGLVGWGMLSLAEHQARYQRLVQWLMSQPARTN